MKGALLFLAACSPGGDRWSYTAQGTGEAKCSCAPTYRPGEFVPRPDLPESGWARQPGTIKVVVTAVGPDAGGVRP